MNKYLETYKQRMEHHHNLIVDLIDNLTHMGYKCYVPKYPNYYTFCYITDKEATKHISLEISDIPWECRLYINTRPSKKSGSSQSISIQPLYTDMGIGKYPLPFTIVDILDNMVEIIYNPGNTHLVLYDIGEETS